MYREREKKRDTSYHSLKTSEPVNSANSVRSSRSPDENTKGQRYQKRFPVSFVIPRKRQALLLNLAENSSCISGDIFHIVPVCLQREIQSVKT